MSERRFLVAADALDAERCGAAFVREEEHHHLSRVLRLRPGDSVSVFDGAGRGFDGVVEEIGRRETRVRLTGPDPRAVEPALRLTLAQGIPHHDRMELVIQKTTEIGVAVVAPIVTTRTVPRSRAERGWGRLERWRRVAREAARQSGRLHVPVVAEPVTWREWLEAREGGAAGPGFLLDPEERSGTVAPILPEGPGPRSASVAVGPEGGFEPAEAALGRERGLSPVSLGPRVLRTETAGIVAVALLLFLAGELGPRPGAAGGGGPAAR